MPSSLPVAVGRTNARASSVAVRIGSAAAVRETPDESRPPDQVMPCMRRRNRPGGHGAAFSLRKLQSLGIVRELTGGK